MPEPKKGQGMPTPWRRRTPSGPGRLLAAAGLDRKALTDTTDLTACREVAYHTAKQKTPAIEKTLAAAEELLLDQANYEFVLAFLEDLQNLVSHGLEDFVTPGQVTALLAPKSLACWTSLAEFWTAVAAWCDQAELPLDPNERLLAVKNEQLRTLLWTSNRTLPTGQKLGLAHVVRYEKAGQPPLPGYSHIAAALDTFGHS
jgi:hypothetical protein